MTKLGGLLIALAGTFMPWSNNIEYALGGVLIFIGVAILTWG